MMNLSEIEEKYSEERLRDLHEEELRDLKSSARALAYLMLMGGIGLIILIIFFFVKLL